MKRRLNRKFWFVIMVSFWITVVVTASTMLWQQAFNRSEFWELGLVLVSALTITVVWWMSKDDKTD